MVRENKERASAGWWERRERVANWLLFITLSERNENKLLTPRLLSPEDKSGRADLVRWTSKSFLDCGRHIWRTNTPLPLESARWKTLSHAHFSLSGSLRFGKLFGFSSLSKRWLSHFAGKSRIDFYKDFIFFRKPSKRFSLNMHEQAFLIRWKSCFQTD